MRREIPTRSPHADEFRFTDKTVTDFLYMPFEKRIEVLDALISKKQLLEIMNVTDILKKKLFTILDISSGTLHYRKLDDLYSFAVSKEILAIIDVYSIGYNNAPEIRAFNDWMLEGKIHGLLPVDYLSHQIGRLEIVNQIKRLKKRGERPFHFTDDKVT